MGTKAKVRLPEQMVRVCRKCYGNEGGGDLYTQCSHAFVQRKTWVGAATIEVPGVRSPAVAANLMGESCLTDFHATRQLTREEILSLESGDAELAIIVVKRKP